MRKLAINPTSIIADRGFYTGKALYENILWLDRPVLFGAHLKHLTQGMNRLDIPPFNEEEKQQLIGLLTNPELKNKNVRLTVSDRNMVIRTENHEPLSTGKQEGLSLQTSALRRNSSSELVGLNVAGDPETHREYRKALSQGFDDSLFYNTEDELCETAEANIFMVAEGKIITSPVSAGLKAGIVRQWVLDNTDVVVRPINHDEVMAAKEFFLTNSFMGIVPVKAIDGRELLFGEKTIDIQKIYRSFIQAHYA